MRKPKFEIYAGKDSKIEFRLKAANGEPVLFGPGFRTKPEAIRAISNVMFYGTIASRFAIRQKADGTYYFLLKTSLGRILGWSEYYHSRQAMLHGIEAVRHAARIGRVLDLLEA
jgi:uncharacterized protein